MRQIKKEKSIDVKPGSFVPEERFRVSRGFVRSIERGTLRRPLSRLGSKPYPKNFSTASLSLPVLLDEPGA